jgi:hypothetical protein
MTMSKTVDDLVLSHESFNCLVWQRRSKPIDGEFTEGQAVLAKCGTAEQHAVVTKNSDGRWIVKKGE